MKRHLFFTAALAGLLSAGGAPSAKAGIKDILDVQSPAAVRSKHAPVRSENTARGEDSVTSPSVAGQRFLEHVNYARLALAMKDEASARRHIASARTQLQALKSPVMQEQTQTPIRSSRIHYDYDSRYKDHYFPVLGPAAMKRMRRGPLWVDTKGIAVTDAEIVYLTLDFSESKAEKRLDIAIASIDKHDLTDAQSHLGELVKDVVNVDEDIALPLDKARDNIVLTRQFVAVRNYAGARYALEHADDALDEMEDDKRYRDREASVEAMRKEVYGMQEQIARQDPTLLGTVDRTLEKWWKALKN